MYLANASRSSGDDYTGVLWSAKHLCCQGFTAASLLTSFHLACGVWRKCATEVLWSMEKIERWSVGAFVVGGEEKARRCRRG